MLQEQSAASGGEGSAASAEVSRYYIVRKMGRNRLGRNFTARPLQATVRFLCT